MSVRAGGAARGGPAGLAAALAVASPVIVGLVYAVLAAVDVVGFGATGSPSLSRVTRVLAERAVWEGVLWSVWVAGAATTISLVLAMVIAAVFRGERRLDRTARALAVTPLPIPHLVAAVLAVLILGQSGVLARVGFALGWVAAPADVPAAIYDPLGSGVILALVWKETPFLALIAFSVLARGIAPLEESARTLGAGGVQVFRRVTAPLLWRGMLPATVAVFVFSVGSYEIVALLAPSDPLALPLLTMERYTGSSLARRGDAFVLALMGLAIAGAAVAAHEWVRRGWSEPDGR